MSRKVNFPAWLTSYNWCRNVLRLPNRRCVGGLLCGSQGYGRGLNVSRACGRWWRWMRRRQQCIEFAASDLTTEIASVLVEKRRSASGSSESLLRRSRRAAHRGIYWLPPAQRPQSSAVIGPHSSARGSGAYKNWVPIAFPLTSPFIAYRAALSGGNNMARALSPTLLFIGLVLAVTYYATDRVRECFHLWRVHRRTSPRGVRTPDARPSPRFSVWHNHRRRVEPKQHGSSLAA